jgi:hypothetical protein
VRGVEQGYSRQEAEKHFRAKPEDIELWRDEEGNWWWLKITTGEIIKAKREEWKATSRRKP